MMRLPPTLFHFQLSLHLQGVMFQHSSPLQCERPNGNPLAEFEGIALPLTKRSTVESFKIRPRLVG
jgi:hypothetical protein